MSSDPKVLIGRLNALCRRALEAGAARCVSQTHYNVEVEHVVLKLLELPASDLEPVLRYYEVDVADLTEELNQAMETFRRGNQRTPAFSPQVLRLLREGWTIASLQLQSNTIRSAALLLALFEDDELRRAIIESCPGLAKIPRDSLRENVADLIRGTAEDPHADARSLSQSGAVGSPGTPDDAGPEGNALAPGGTPPIPGARQGTKALDLYTIDLTEEARAGRIDPIRGRSAEIRQVIDILMRRRQNNPILVGDAGVGKTAVVEGFARQVAAGEVPRSLERISVRTLDLGLLQAGAGVRGEFEERLKAVLAEVAGAEDPVILFIDEAHNLIGAGGTAGQGDAANLLKPALGRGAVRTIAATTWSEYKRHFEKDPALTRRFQVIKVDEPDEGAAIEMLRGIAQNLERHHGVRILDEAIRDAVRFSDRYLSERRLPDKAISVLDTAGARVALAQDGKPSALEDIERDVERIELELELLLREEASGTDHAESIEEKTSTLQSLSSEHEAVEEAWKRETSLIKRIRSLEEDLESQRATEEADLEELASLSRQIVELKERCRTIQDGKPMVPLCVDSGVVASVVSGWTGIPVGRMLTDEIDGILSLEERLGARIIGQPQALAAICQRISTFRAGLEDPGKPKGVFLLVGPTGIGKTETALVLAEVLYGGERNLVSLNMSEFQEPHSVATLKGSPPGYVGFGSGGVLTEAVRRRPYSVVLLDEVEKAHRDVLELFYQVFDKGILEDAEGVPVDFKNTVMLLTANVGAEVISRACADAREPPDPEVLMPELREALLSRFPPALLGRLVIVPYYPLSRAEIESIVRLKLDTVRTRFRHNHAAELTFDESLAEHLAEKCGTGGSGARNIDQILTQTLLPEIANRVLARMAGGDGLEEIHVTAEEVERLV